MRALILAMSIMVCLTMSVLANDSDMDQTMLTQIANGAMAKTEWLGRVPVVMFNSDNAPVAVFYYSVGILTKPVINEGVKHNIVSVMSCLLKDTARVPENVVSMYDLPDAAITTTKSIISSDVPKGEYFPVFAILCGIEQPGILKSVLSEPSRIRVEKMGGKNFVMVIDPYTIRSKLITVMIDKDGVDQSKGVMKMLELAEKKKQELTR